MKYFGISILIIAIIISLTVGGWAWRYYTAEIRGTVDAEEQIESAPSRISNYNRFYNLCSNVQQYETQIDVQENMLEKTVDSDRKDRIQSNIAGLKGQRAHSIQRYNAMARQNYTAGRFRASDLPYQLDTNADETICYNTTGE